MSGTAVVLTTFFTFSSFWNKRSTEVIMDFLPVKWKLAKLDRQREPLPNVPSREGFKERDIKSKDRGLLRGIAEYGKSSLGLIGVITEK